MRTLDIWVEGIADQRFLADVLKLWFQFDYDIDDGSKTFKCRGNQHLVRLRATGTVEAFRSAKEWHKLKNDFRDNQNAYSITNLVIIDIDDNFDLRKHEVLSTCTDLVTNENLFLWPNNQPQSRDEKGDLERLLEQIINPNNTAIFECWKTYEACLGETYTTPARKTKIYAYLEALLGESKKEKEKIKERERDYTNTNHWQLDHTTEPLKPLYDFLKKHLGL